MHAPFVQRYFSWMPVGDLQIDAAFQLDQLSMMMMLVITGVGTLIHLFSVGYMQDDPGYPRYFAYLNLFVFFMLLLVLGGNYPLLFIGWEGVGLCSYLLIGFWFSEKANADAGKKAFIVNRIGDFGFLVAMFMLFANLRRRSTSSACAPRPTVAADGRRGGHGDLPVPVPRLRRQERADSALRLAARRHGRPDAGLRAHPRGDDGHGRRLPDRAQQHAVLARAGRADRRRGHRRADGGLRGVDRPQAVGHQEGPRVFDRLAARLHVRRRRLGRVRRRRVPPRDARVLQGAAVPRFGLGDLRDARRRITTPDNHEDAQDMRNMGGLKKYMPDHVRADVDRDAGDRRHSAARRLLLEGRDPRHACSRVRTRVRRSRARICSAFRAVLAVSRATCSASPRRS